MGEKIDLDYEFSELPKRLRINSILVVVLAWISLALIIAGIVCLCIFQYTKWALGIFLSGIVLIIISAILKTFIYYETEKFVKKVLPNVRNRKRFRDRKKRNILL